ncbi:TetR/AcrR family transcriptional regulator [Parafrankia discariae]|uniref:TetR/AcrR family transcriptional regulator n=1 Tax=Parafrankia discariae TaxID=365528 RepID=UPI000371BE6D|nr:TetR/AcrR family transcriptional regulator [Parafrankia discariae]
MVGHPERRTQVERRAASEAALLRAAAELIAERGFERTSLRGIGARAGTSREMPAYHFGSKESLITRLAERAHERTLEATAEALERADRRAEELSALETLRVTIETYLEVIVAADAPEERAVVVMWGATFPSDSPLPAAVDADRQTHRDLAESIRAGQQDGSIRAEADADAAALLVMAMARGTAALSLAHPDAADPAKVQALCGEAITALLQAPSPTVPDRPEPFVTSKRTSRPG